MATSCPFRRYCCSGPAVLVVTSSVEPSSVAGTGTLWAGGAVAEFSLGGGQTGAVALGDPEERTTTLSGGPGGGERRVRTGSQPSPSLFWKPGGQHSPPAER